MLKSYHCDLCTHKPFKAPTALGRHKLSAHGIPGQSHSSIAYRKAKEIQNAVKTQDRPVLSKVQQKPPQAQIPEGALAVAFGRFQELCRSFAFEYDLPAKLFTTRLTQLIAASQIR